MKEADKSFAENEVGVTIIHKTKPNTAGKAPVSPFASAISEASNIVIPIVIHEIVAYCIAVKIGLRTLRTIIGDHKAPKPVVSFTKTFVQRTPTAPEIVAGIKFWNAFLIAFKYLF